MTKGVKMNTDNVWLGGNELVIVCHNSYYCVRECYEDYNVVFRGSYKKCVEYCVKRLIDYEESIIG